MQSSSSLIPIEENLIKPVIFGVLPVETNCPHCHTHIITTIEYVPGLCSWLIFGVCVVTGFILFIPWLLCFLPLTVKKCKDIQHSCPTCKNILGSYKRL